AAMPSGAIHRPPTIPTAPAISRAARTGKYRAGTPTVPPMTDTTCSFLRSFITAELTLMRASRTVTITRAMNRDPPILRLRDVVGCGRAGATRTVGDRAGACVAWLPAEFLANLWEHFRSEEFDAAEE